MLALPVIGSGSSFPIGPRHQPPEIELVWMQGVVLHPLISLISTLNRIGIGYSLLSLSYCNQEEGLSEALMTTEIQPVTAKESFTAWML